MNALSGLSGLSSLVENTIVVSSPANEVQIMYFGSSSSPKTPVSGTYTLTFDSQTTSSINYNDTAATIKTVLESLSTIGSGNIDVTSISGGFRFEFKGVLEKTDVSLISASANLKQSANSVVINTIQSGVETVNINADNQITQAALDTSEQQSASLATNSGTGTSWNDLSNITYENGSYVSCDVSSGSNSKILNIFFGNFNIPSYATITGVLVEVKRYKDGAGTFNESVSRIMNGSSSGTNFSGSPTWSSVSTFDSIGGSTELHGLTLSPSDFNSGNVKYRCQIYATGGSNGQGYVDTARMTVYYVANQIETCTFSGQATYGTISLGPATLSYNDNYTEVSISGAVMNGGPQTSIITRWTDYNTHFPLTIGSNTLAIPGRHHIFSVTLVDTPTEGNYYLDIVKDAVTYTTHTNYNIDGVNLAAAITIAGIGCNGSGFGPDTITIETQDNVLLSSVSGGEYTSPLLKSLGIEIIVSQQGHS